MSRILIPQAFANICLRKFRELYPGQEPKRLLVSYPFVVGLSKVQVPVERIAWVVSHLLSEEGHAGLEAHPQTDGQDVVRRGDGAVLYRVAVKRNTPAAPRIVYWVLGSTVELELIGTHDGTLPRRYRK